MEKGKGLVTFFNKIVQSTIHEATFLVVVQKWKFSRSTAPSFLPSPSGLSLSLSRIIGCNYIKVETYNTRHLALPPSLPRSSPGPTTDRQAGRLAMQRASGRELLCGTSVICHAIQAAGEFLSPSLFQVSKKAVVRLRLASMNRRISCKGSGSQVELPIFQFCEMKEGLV